MKILRLLNKTKLSNYFFIKNIKPTMRFVALVATPLCLVNSYIAAYESPDFYSHWFSKFLFSFIMTYPQAVVYVSFIRWFDSRNKVAAPLQSQAR